MEENELNESEYLIELGEYYLNEGFPELAIDILNKLIERDPQNILAYNVRGMAFGDMSEFVESIADFGVVITSDQYSGLGYCNRGLTYYYCGMLDNAISDLTRAIQLRSDNKSQFADRARVWSQYANSAPSSTEEYITRAISDYTQAINLGLNTSTVFEERGNMYLSKGDVSNALVDYRRALAINPNDLHSQVNLMVVLSKMNSCIS